MFHRGEVKNESPSRNLLVEEGGYCYIIEKGGVRFPSCSVSMP